MQLMRWVFGGRGLRLLALLCLIGLVGCARSGFNGDEDGGPVEDGIVEDDADQPDAGEDAGADPGADEVDDQPPERSNGQPSGTIPAGSSAVRISLRTDEVASCRCANTNGIPYDDQSSMQTDDGLEHYRWLTGLLDGESYGRYVKCRDARGNTNTSDFTIRFDVDTFAVTPIYRSVGPNNENPLAAGAGLTELTVRDGTALFEHPISTTVGIGDVVINNWYTDSDHFIRIYTPASRAPPTTTPPTRPRWVTAWPAPQTSTTGPGRSFGSPARPSVTSTCCLTTRAPSTRAPRRSWTCSTTTSTARPARRPGTWGRTSILHSATGNQNLVGRHTGRRNRQTPRRVCIARHNPHVQSQPLQYPQHQPQLDGLLAALQLGQEPGPYPGQSCGTSLIDSGFLAPAAYDLPKMDRRADFPVRDCC